MVVISIIMIIMLLLMFVDVSLIRKHISSKSLLEFRWNWNPQFPSLEAETEQLREKEAPREKLFMQINLVNMFNKNRKYTKLYP